MKRIITTLILLFALFVISGCSAMSVSDYLRIHIRANSNSVEDQNIKYLIKDVVVEYMSPLLKDANSKNDAIQIIESNSANLKQIIDGVLTQNGFNYECSISINNEFFPTRTYDDLTLESGFYDALIVNLGNAVGNNWWCVVYPNMCFNELENVVYKSKIAEIISRIMR